MLPVPNEHPGPDSREAYSLKISAHGVTASARSSAGLFYAVQTLKQVVEGTGAQAVLPVVKIKDWPAAQHGRPRWNGRLMHLTCFWHC